MTRRRVSTRDLPASVLAEVTDRQGGKFCVYCREAGLTTPPEQRLVLDHKQPLSLGGTDDPSNLQWACEAHNGARGNRPIAAATKHPPTWARRRRR